MTSGVAMVRFPENPGILFDSGHTIQKHPAASPKQQTHIMGGLHGEKENADYIDYLLIR